MKGLVIKLCSLYFKSLFTFLECRILRKCYFMIVVAMQFVLTVMVYVMLIDLIHFMIIDVKYLA